MGLAYLFALVVGLGILLVQVVIGAAKDADADKDLSAKDFAAKDFDADKDLGGKDVDAGEGGFVALFLSTRFWIFASLGFGLSGTLLTYVFSGSFLPTLLTAVLLGLVSGLTAAWAYRVLRRAASRPTEHAQSAVGKIAQVLVPIAPKKMGQVRVEIGGQTVDLPARSDGSSIARGELVVVEDVEGELAVVSPAPEEIKVGAS